eukprot:scaffold12034_cov155-Isochrysis_galbana.AAC.3
MDVFWRKVQAPRIKRTIEAGTSWGCTWRSITREHVFLQGIICIKIRSRHGERMRLFQLRAPTFDCGRTQRDQTLLQRRV